MTTSRAGYKLQISAFWGQAADVHRVKISPMHDDRHDNIFDDNDAFDFLLYENLEKQDRE